MAVCESFKIDSNETSLRFAVEKCLKKLPTLAEDGADPVWHPLEPNSYGDMGATITTVARNPINPSRQRQKGVVTDLEASASFVMDLTGNNHLHMMESYTFALSRQKPTTIPLNAAQIPVTAVTAGTGYAMNSTFSSVVEVGDIILAKNFGIAVNNGPKVVTAVGAGTVMAAGLSAEAVPPSNASLTVVGFQAASGDLNLTVNGSVITLNSTALNFASLGLIPGEWIYVGGDTATTSFANNAGFARVSAISTNTLTFDKTSWVPATEVGAAKTIQLYLGTVIRNENDPANIVRKPLQFERTLGRDTDGVMSQYIIGSVANEFTLTVPQADKITAELGFVATDAVSRSGLEGLKVGTRPGLVTSDAFNASSDVRRLAFSLPNETAPLFVYATDLTLTINNNASGSKAIGVLGSFDITTGTFDIGGSVTAYFQDVRAINAVRNNEDISMDIVMVKSNVGIIFDIPLLTLENGLPNVEQDQAITIPLDTIGAESVFGHTLMYVNFPYVPNAA